MSQGSLLPLLFDAQASGGWTAGMVEVTRALLARLDLPFGARLLEVGCGGGALLRALREQRPDLRLVGLDLHPGALAAASTCGLSLLQATLLQLPFGDADFDCVLALDVLDQVAVPLAPALAELVRVLRPNGALIVRVSAYAWLWGAHDMAFNTGRRFATDELASALQDAGVRPLRITHANTLLAAPVVGLRTIDRFRTRPALSGVYASPFANRLVYAALRTESQWLRRYDLPAGLSLLAVARRQGLHTHPLTTSPPTERLNAGFHHAT